MQDNKFNQLVATENISTKHNAGVYDCTDYHVMMKKL